ncbi:DUF6205 family protein [Micromonospora sp. DT227]|uniref:DUF6205 family protein n=1 Tax=Micromonospora sp. DT227 TaxID=3393433 RepID=UPI003CEC6885
MGYSTRVTGAIQISPPIPWSILGGSRFVGPPHPRVVDMDCVLRVVEQVPEAGDGSTVRRVAVAITGAMPDPYSAYNLLDHVQKIVDLFGDGRTFTGRPTCTGDEPGDIWRVEVHDGRVTRVEPRIVWPDGTEGLTA